MNHTEFGGFSVNFKSPCMEISFLMQMEMSNAVAWCSCWIDWVCVCVCECMVHKQVNQALFCNIHVCGLALSYRKCWCVVCNHIVPLCTKCFVLGTFLYPYKIPYDCMWYIVHSYLYHYPIDTYRVRLFNDIKDAQLLWNIGKVYESVCPNS